MANIDPKDSVFANAADAVSDFETIFDEEDSIIEMVVGFGENGESLIGRDPEEEYTTDNSDGKVDMEDSSPSTAQTVEPDAETGKGVVESMDLDELFGIGEADDGSKETVGTDAETGKEVQNKLSDGQVSGEQTDKTNKSNMLEEPVEKTEKDFHNEGAELDELFESLGLNENDEQTDKTNKSNMLEEPVETDWKDFHNESGEIDLDEMFNSVEEGCCDDPITAASRVQVCPKCGQKTCNCGGTDNKSKAEEQSDKTNKSNMLEEPVETDWKDFHNEGAELDELFESLGLNEGDEQTDETNKSDILEEPVETDEKDFHNEGAALDTLFESIDELLDESEEQTDKTNKSNMLEEPVETDWKDFHNESTDLDAFFESLEDEKEHDEFNDSLEGMESKGNIVKEADDIDYAEDELIKAADDNNSAGNVKLDYKPGEDDAIIDDVIKSK